MYKEEDEMVREITGVECDEEKKELIWTKQARLNYLRSNLIILVAELSSLLFPSPYSHPSLSSSIDLLPGNIGLCFSFNAQLCTA